MDIKPFLHEHHLLFDEYLDQEAFCDHCNRQIDGWAFTCETCKFWLHESCAKQQLPSTISHPLHSQHLLTLLFTDYFYVCGKCFSLTRRCIYRCKDCDFNLDLLCASSTTNDETPHEEWERSYHRYKTIEHFSHVDKLNLFNYRKVGKDEYICRWCEKLLSGMSYGCFLFCTSEEVFFHESCLINMPTIISKHHFHPSHPLYLRDLPGSLICNACGDELKSKKTNGYSCTKCIFHLHVTCATFQPSLKHELHEHHLTYFKIKHYFGSLQCKKCNEMIRLNESESAFYRCVECDFNLHLRCASLPFTAKHEYHRHELMLVHSFIEDGSNEYYCDICEKERKPKHHVYCCKKCKFVAHIGCVLHKSIDTEFEHGSTSSLVDSKASIGKVTEQEGTEIDYFDHQHPLRFYEVIRKNESLLCHACWLKIYDQAYVCKYGCAIYLHKACTKLSYELLHPLHPQHSLKLITSGLRFTCDECRERVDSGYVYMCYACDFKLDVKCATLSVPKHESQRLKEMERRSKLCPLNQLHKLNFFIYGSTLWTHPRCHFCAQVIRGPSYRCFNCEYKLHESCLGFPLEMQLHFHPLHNLRLIPVEERICLVCKDASYLKIKYSCLQCDLHLHPYCAKSLKRMVKSKSHVHNLYYFGPNAWNKFYHEGKTCDECKERFSFTPFYFCMECGIKLHIKCAVPHSVKSKYHIHPFTLKGHSLKEDLGEYYCDICEEERDPQHHSYYCAKCEGLFVAHIDCVLNSVSSPTIYNL
ncbi:uncharacterized protein LOC111277538 [Durio zibethinus]|uniref:Uncharacterized protein LOC111277538 n=1 Tax=Durio zibethinus TaxID=66656 RepID=A0A6P5WU81_DURZI|nr:uncharacterized protein LOC111277538 [Durio zibethinus]